MTCQVLELTHNTAKVKSNSLKLSLQTLNKATAPEWVVPLRLFGDGAESYRILGPCLVDFAI